MTILKKIKEKGIEGCLYSIKSRLVKVYNGILMKKFSNLPIDEYSIVLESEGDCCDNAFALFDYMKQNGYLQKYKVTWLVDKPKNFKEEYNVQYVQKNIHNYFSLNTLKALSTCHWYVYDHCNMMANFNKKEGQRISYLCHGYAGFKAAKGSGIFCADEEFTTGEIPMQGCIDFNGEKAKKYDFGFSRLDYFYNSKPETNDLAEELVEKDNYKKVFLWMPTFRQSVNKELSEEYFKNETGLPLFETCDSMKSINDFLANINVKIVLKIHHLQSGLEIFEKKFTNIQFLKDEDINKKGLQLYQFIPVFDALITDYSSISTDFFLLDKPIIYILDDIEDYKKSRGLYPENAMDYMPGDHVYNIAEFKEAIKKVVDGEDCFKVERNLLLPKFHTYQDGNASKRILNHLGILV